MNKALCISAAIAMALSGAAFAQGGASSRPPPASVASAPPAPPAPITLKDCETLSVNSARNACMQSVERSSGGDAGAVGGTSSRGAKGKGGVNQKSDAAITNK